AEKCFNQAVGVARRQDALAWELRAAMSLARLWRGQRRVSQARKLLEPVYHRFTEGFGTVDLVAAKALLTSMRGAMKEFPPFRLDTVNQRKQRIGWTPPRARPRHGSPAGAFSGGPRTPSRHVPLGAVREEHPRQRRADYEADAAALVRSSGSPDAGDRNGMLWSPVRRSRS